MVGVDDPVTRHDDLDAAFKGAPVGMTKSCCVTRPMRRRGSRSAAPTSCCQGHTHGGQIYVKGITDRLMKKVGLNYRRGMYPFGEHDAVRDAGRRILGRDAPSAKAPRLKSPCSCCGMLLNPEAA